MYLGGLGDDGTDLSHHLASRHAVGAELRTRRPVTEFRAAVVIGAGSASFEMLRQLTERLPGDRSAPRWVQTRCQPIGIRDVLDYLVGALDRPEVTGIVESRARTSCRTAT